MTGSPDHLPVMTITTDGQVDTPGYRAYTPADYETAYHVWAGPAGRSNRRTAALLGHPHTTVSLWSRRFDWDQRYAEGAAASVSTAAREADRVVQAMIVAGQVPAIAALHQIIADPNHKRRDVAALAMLALGGRPLPKAPTITASKTLGDGTVVSVKASDLQHLNPQELAHYARTGELPEGASEPGTPPRTDPENMQNVPGGVVDSSA